MGGKRESRGKWSKIFRLVGRLFCGLLVRSMMP